MVVPVHAIRGGGGGLAPLSLYQNTFWMRVVSFNPRESASRIGGIFS